MPRTKRNNPFENRNPRLAELGDGKEHWTAVDEDISLGYRKGKRKSTWYVRTYEGNGKYRQRPIGIADDYQDADGETVLTYFQAQDKAKQVARHAKTEEKPLPKRDGPTVEDVLDDYMEYHRSESTAESVSATGYIVKAIKWAMGHRPANAITTKEIARWHRGFVGSEDNPEAARKRKATANRNLTVLKAALNHAWREGDITDRDRWQRVGPFKRVEKGRQRYLTRAECRKLLAKCDEDFRRIARAAVLTGARYGELRGLLVGDYDREAGTVAIVRPKAGDARHVPLTDEGAAFFDEMTAGRAAGEYLFLRADGEPWQKSQQIRRMRDASTAAKIDPPATFHNWRHTYISELARRGVPFSTISKAVGSGVQIIERHYARLQPDHVADTIRKAMPKLDTRKGKVRRIG